MSTYLKQGITNFAKFRHFKNITKELSFCNKLKFSNPYSFATWWCKPLIFQTKTIRSNRINSLKYERSRRMGCQVIEIRKSEFVANTHFLLLKLLFRFQFTKSNKVLHISGNIDSTKMFHILEMPNGFILTL